MQQKCPPSSETTNLELRDNLRRESFTSQLPKVENLTTRDMKRLFHPKKVQKICVNQAKSFIPLPGIEPGSYGYPLKFTVESRIY